MRECARPYPVRLLRRDRVFETLDSDRALRTKVAGDFDGTLPHLLVGEVFGEEHFGDVLTGSPVFREGISEGLILSPVRHTLRL